MKKITAAILVFMLLFSACAENKDRPNVVLIIVDTLRADVLGCYGNNPSISPNIDRLAAGGAIFHQCITAVPVTLPSISSILTSSYPTYHGVRDNGVFVLDESLVTMAEAFRDAGYSTAGVVGAYVVAEQSGIAQGFDHFDSDFSGDYLKESSLLEERAVDVAETQRRAEEVTRLAVEWIEQVKGPFFLMVHYFDPHSPYDPPPEYLEKYGRDLIRKYLGEVAYTDKHLGPLLQAAETVSGERDLLTAFVADHGEGLKEHGETQHGFFLYDSTVRVPFILHFPGHILPAMVVQEQTPTIDLAPTVLELTGLSIPESWHGQSLAARVGTTPIPVSGAQRAEEADDTSPKGGAAPRGKIANARTGPHICYMETYRTRYSYNWSELLGVRHNLWKLVRAPRPELYYLADDPREQENLYEDRPDMAASMELLLDRIIAGQSGPLGDLGPSLDLDQEEIKKLEALGYVMPEKTVPSGPLPDPKDQITRLNMRFDSKELVKTARVRMNNNDLDGARRDLDRALELDPDNSVAVHDIGAIHFRKGEFKEALPYFEKAIHLSPTKSAAREHLGMTYMKLDRPEDAVRELEAAVALEPEKADLRLGYGLALKEIGDLNSALQQFYKAIELDGDQAAAYYQAALTLTLLGRFDDATANLQEMSVKNPSKKLAELGRLLLEDIEKRRRR